MFLKLGTSTTNGCGMTAIKEPKNFVWEMQSLKFVRDFPPFEEDSIGRFSALGGIN